MKKRICFVDQTLNGGGAERVACTIIRGLPAELFDIHLVILSSPGDLIDIIPEHVDIHILNARSTKSAILPFFKAIQSISPDIIFTTTHRTNILSALTGILFRKTKTVGRCPNMISTEAELDETALPLPLISFFYSKMDCIIAQTQLMKDDLIKHTKVTSDKIIAISNPIDTEFILSQIISELSPPYSDAFNIVFSGRLDQQKGLDTLIKALSITHSSNPNFTLNILGGHSPYQKNIEDLIDTLSLKDNVNFLGHLSNPFPFYANCDLFILPSRYEGFPNVLLENIFLGNDVISSRSIPICEYLIKNFSPEGDLFDVDDSEALAKLISKRINAFNPEQRKAKKTNKQLVEFSSKNFTSLLNSI